MNNRAHLRCFSKLEKEAKIDQKVKVNPFTFWSILGTFSTFLKSLKNHLKTLQMRLKTFLKWFALIFEVFFKSLEKKLRLTPLVFGRFWPLFQLF
jgi:hypothetical protein